MSDDPAPGSVAAVFVALADPSRRRVIGVIARTGSATPTAIAEEMAITRQAVAKHLGTLAGAGLVESERVGRQVHYRLRAAPLQLAARWLEAAAGAWDSRLDALKRSIEQGRGDGDGPSRRETHHGQGRPDHPLRHSGDAR